MRIQPGIIYSTSPEYKIIGQNPNNSNDFYIYQQFYDQELSFGLTSGIAVKYILVKNIYAILRTDLTFISPKFEIVVNNDGRFSYKDYTPYITTFSALFGLGYKF